MRAKIFKIIQSLFKKDIEALAKERLDSLALDEYIDKNMFLINGKSGPEMEFHGKRFIRHMAASFHEIVKDADNYVTMGLTCEGYAPLTVTIQKRWKLSPHERAEKMKTKLEKTKKELDELKKDYKKLIEVGEREPYDRMGGAVTE
jgi:hypothetical protein